jgi:SAM-dependent methyltransferase
MNDFQKKYYEQAAFWEKDYMDDPAEKERILESIKLIPDDTMTIIDVGCGNGSFLNTLNEKHPNSYDKIIGIDTSSEALRHVKTKTKNESIDNISFDSKSFDTVCCSEVLEHLPYNTFEKGISEIQRISKKYIIISVPNDEILERSLVLCTECSCAFNPYFHMRRFNKSSLKELFNNFVPVKIVEFGPVERIPLFKIYLWFLRLGYRKNRPPRTSFCPQCGYQQKKGNYNNYEDGNHKKKDIIGLSLSFIKKFFIKERVKRRWLVALYKRIDA